MFACTIFSPLSPFVSWRYIWDLCTFARKCKTFIRMSMGGGGCRWVGRGATLHELLNVNIMHDSLYSCTFICPLFADALYECNGTKTYFSSVQFKMVSMSSEKPICAPPSLSEVSPMLPLKRFQCSSDWRWPSLVLSRKIVLRFLFPHLSPPDDRWCDALGFVLTGKCLKLNTSSFPRSKPLVRVALPASLFARSFPFTPACPGQYTSRSFGRGMSTILVWDSLSSIHFL